SREPFPGDGAGLGMVRNWGACTTKWALSAIWLGDSRLGRCCARIRDFCGSERWRLPRPGRKHVSGLGCAPGAGGVRGKGRAAGARISPSHWLRVTGLLVTIMIAGAGWNQTEARASRNGPPKRVIHGPNYRPPYAAIVVDDKSGFVLHEVSADEPRHPASLTKIMT